MRFLLGAGLVAAVLGGCSTLGSTSSRTACRVQLLLDEAAVALEDSMTATFGGDSDAVVAEGHKLQQLASDLDALVPFLRDVSTDVVDDIAGAATSAQQTGDALSAVTAEDPADVDLVNLARESIHQVEDRWIERVRDAGVTCAGQKV